MTANARVCGRVPPYIDSTKIALFVFPSNSEKLSKELFAILDAELE